MTIDELIRFQLHAYRDGGSMLPPEQHRELIKGLLALRRARRRHG